MNPKPDADDERALRTLEYAQQMLGVSRSTLYRLEKQGRITFVRLGRTIRVTQASLNKLTEELNRQARLR